MEQSITRSDCVSSDMALHREADVVSCWDRPCKLAALMKLGQQQKSIKIELMQCPKTINMYLDICDIYFKSDLFT